MKRVAPQLGFSDYQALLKTYVGKGLRQDLEKIEKNNVAPLANNSK